MSIKITICTNTDEYPLSTTLTELAAQYQTQFTSPIVAAFVDKHEKSLHYQLEHSATVEFIELRSAIGLRIYTRSLLMLLQMALRKLGLEHVFNVRGHLADAFFCKLDLDSPVDANLIKILNKTMQDLVHEDIPIEYHKLPLQEARKYLASIADNIHYLGLIQSLHQDTISYYKARDTINYFFSPLVPSTGYLKVFELAPYRGDILIKYPNIDNIEVIPPYFDRPQLATVYTEAEAWAALLECDNIADINQKIATKEFEDIMYVSEALQEKRIAQIADLITAQLHDKRLVLIAGPSSSGKTTFANRLRIQLRVNGLKPVAISVDDYFVNREHTPLDAQGNYDFESIHTIDLELFNKDLTKIINGERVELPSFNFTTGQREYKGNFIQVTPEQPIIIEGIHCLNDLLTQSIAVEHKVKIYVSAITGVALNEYNMIPTTDCRILRRIVRDSKYRAHTAAETIRMWPNVRAGEEKNIFPFQEDAQIMFNTSLIYELPVLKKHVEPLLREITFEQPEYAEACRLLDLLNHVQVAENINIPPNSLLREFIGPN